MKVHRESRRPLSSGLAVMATGPSGPGLSPPEPQPMSATTRPTASRRPQRCWDIQATVSPHGVGLPYSSDRHVAGRVFFRYRLSAHLAPNLAATVERLAVQQRAAVCGRPTAATAC